MFVSQGIRHPFRGIHQDIITYTDSYIKHRENLGKTNRWKGLTVHVAIW